MQKEQIPSQQGFVDKPALSQMQAYLHSNQSQDVRAEFLNKLSHELRTPLTVIKLYVEAIEDGMFESNKDAFQQLKVKFERFELLLDEMLKNQSIKSKNLFSAET